MNLYFDNLKSNNLKSSNINQDLYITNFLTRFDLMAKYIYIKFKVYDIDTNFHIDLYHSHMITFNNCCEYPGTKIGIEDFITHYDKLINGMKLLGYDKNTPIPMGRNNIIINGAHRLITSFFYNIQPVFQYINEIGCTGYDDHFFLERKEYPVLKRVYSDFMALNYINIDKNIRCLIVYPIVSGYNKYSEIEQIINIYGKKYYDKDVILNKNGISNLIKELYRGEDWIGGMFPTGFSPGNKANLCTDINQNSFKIKIYLFHIYNVNLLIEMKEKCRNIFKIGKHSLHISDYTTDTFRIASSLLNENSVFFLNHGTNDISSKTRNLLNEYFSYNSYKSSEGLCLTSGLILELFGVRETNDIDYLYRHLRNDTLKLEFNNINISEHKGVWEKFYSISKDDIIFNPNNHFYINGYKFATLKIVKEMKEKRHENKDIQDVKMIQFLSANKCII